MFSNLFQKIVEATFSDIKRKQKSITSLFPTFGKRVQAIGQKGGVRLRDVQDDVWNFKVHSGTKKNTWYDIVVHFKNVAKVLARVAKDRRLWLTSKKRVDYTKLAQAFLDKADIQLSCTCPAQLYYGGDYVLSKDKYDAKYGDKEKRPPKVRNPKEYGAHCKHVQAVFKVLPFYQNTAAKWLRDFYSDEIKAIEQGAEAEVRTFKKAAAGLKARGEEEPELPTPKPTKPVKPAAPAKPAAAEPEPAEKPEKPVRPVTKKEEPETPEEEKPEGEEEETPTGPPGGQEAPEEEAPEEEKPEEAPEEEKPEVAPETPATLPKRQPKPAAAPKRVSRRVRRPVKPVKPVTSVLTPRKRPKIASQGEVRPEPEV